MSFMLCLFGSLMPSVLITFPLFPDKHSTLLYSKLDSNVLTEYMHSLYQGVCLVLAFAKQFQVINMQQVIQFESLAVPFVTSLCSSQQTRQWDHAKNKQCRLVILNTH